MKHYYFEDDSFVIEDYQHAKRFCSFLPAIAGVDGKPLWAFYANVGQCMGGFGTDDKDTPMTPFDSAVLAYQNIPIKHFRTFCKIDGKDYSFFEGENETTRILKINKSFIVIIEENKNYKVEITYSTVSKRPYAGLIRNVSFTNKDNKEHEYELCDGLPIFLPRCLTNYGYNETGTLMSAYCSIKMNNNAPYFEFKNSNTDESIIDISYEGNTCVSIDNTGKRLDYIVDLNAIFGDDSTLTNPISWKKNGVRVVEYEQQIENKIPCAFAITKFKLNQNEKYEFSTLYGAFKSIDELNKNIRCFDVNKSKEMVDETERLVNSLLPMNIHTNNKLFDEYIKQSYLDNYLRGGFPIILDNKKGGEPYYVFSRKHGDMERDYNSFSIPSMYYSSGPGNFRDVNQNRRNDLYFNKEIGDYNIKIFFLLIQMDGCNPLIVKSPVFKKNHDFNEQLLKKTNPIIIDELNDMLENGATPGEIYTLLKDNNDDDIDVFFAELLGNCHQEVEAIYKEGYWIDHWVYNLDLLENYKSVFPDKISNLLFDDYSYGYYHSLAYINPRSEKYCLVEPGKIRQYGAVDNKKFKKDNEAMGLKGTETLWKTNQFGKVIRVNLATKIINLILIKFSCLDAHQTGLEMESEKPGWNDACNGLPGLFTSSMNEVIELVRLIDFTLCNFNKPNGTISFTVDQKKLYETIKNNLPLLISKKITSFEYWDRTTMSREELRKNTYLKADNNGDELLVKEVLPLLETMKTVLIKGINAAKDLGGGIVPSYIINEVSKYELTDKYNHLKYQIIKPLEFKQKILPHFLEAPARLAKLGKEYFDEKDYQEIFNSGLRDKKYGFYLTSEVLDSASVEIGRVRSFSRGWLERECNFLHMTYKYLLGLLKCGLYKDFYDEMKINFVFNMDPNVYGRSPLENSSFIVPSINPDKKLHGQGQYARLTGANAEVLDMFYLMFLGEQAFNVVDGKLRFTPYPKLDKSFFDENDEVSFPLFKSVITYHNKDKINTYEGCKLTYIVDGKQYDVVEGSLAEDIRNGVINSVYIEISKLQ